MKSVYARIFLRYFSMALMTHGYLTQGEADMIAMDPDLLMLIEMWGGGAIAAISELWYLVAKKTGRAT